MPRRTTACSACSSMLNASSISKEETIIGDFDHSLRESLQAFTNTTWRKRAKPGAETLSLVEVEDYERSLALEDHRQARGPLSRQMNELHALAQRLSALLGGRPIPPNRFRRIHCRSSAYSTRPAASWTSRKSAAGVLHLFDRYVMSRLGDSYADLNRRLVELGILPNIKFDYQRYGGDAGNGGRQPGTSGGRWRGVRWAHATTWTAGRISAPRYHSVCARQRRPRRRRWRRSARC